VIEYGQVKIGPEFFAKSRADYANWKWAIVREFMQNSVDCGSKRIDVAVSEQDGKTTLTFTNDGEPMDRETLVGKLLSLGSSGKNFVGSVGGFGKAKELLYFCHDSYSIRTGRLDLHGSGACYEISETADELRGTVSTVVIDGEFAGELAAQTRRLVCLSRIAPAVYLNGEQIEGRLNRGSRRKSLEFGDVYSNRQHAKLLVCRIGGLAMWARYVEYKGCIVLELNGASSDVMTSNRDGLKYNQRCELDSFLDELAADKNSALKNREQTTYKHIRGIKLDIAAEKKEVLRDEIGGMSVTIALEPQGETVTKAADPDLAYQPQAGSVSALASGSGTVSRETATPQPKSVSFDFILKNEAKRAVPVRYDPSSEAFCTHGRRLAEIWAKVLWQIHQTLGHDAQFSIGFVFSDDTEAQYEQGDYGRVYLINPCRHTGSSYVKRFATTEKHRIIAVAVHEAVHGMGLGRHDEDYAGKLTDVMGPIMKDVARGRFRWCFATGGQPENSGGHKGTTPAAQAETPEQYVARMASNAAAKLAAGDATGAYRTAVAAKAVLSRRNQVTDTSQLDAFKSC